MAQPNAPKVLDEDAKIEWARKKAKKKYKSQERKYRREAETENGELNLIAMMDMMTILLVFLIKSYGAAEISVTMNADMTPPTSRSTIAPQQSVTVTISKKDISVGEKGVVRLENGKVPDSARAAPGSPLIVPVKDALDKEIEKLGKLAANNKKMQAQAGTEKDPLKILMVVADKDMTYELLYSILGTAGQSGLKYFKFLVIQGGS